MYPFRLVDIDKSDILEKSNKGVFAMGEFLKKWAEAEADMPREGAFSSTHWVHGVDGEAPYPVYDMYNSISGIPIPDNPAMAWGRKLEGIMAVESAAKISDHLQLGEFIAEECPTRFCVRRGAVFRNTCDRVLKLPGWDEEYGLEIKTVGSFQQKRLWGDQWSNSVPAHVHAQCQSHMAANGWRLCFVGAWFYTASAPEIYVIDRDDEFIEMAMDGLCDWWDEHIVGKKAPPIDGSDACTRYYQRIDALRPDLLDGCNEEDLELKASYVMAKKMEKEAKDNLSKVKNLLRERIGPAGGVSFGDEGTIKWSTGSVRRFSDTLSMGE